MLLFLAIGGCAEGPTSLDRALALEFQAPSQVKVGDAIPLSLRVTNTSDRQVAVTLSCVGAELEVIRADGTYFYNTRQSLSFSCGTPLDLAPLESRIFSAAWDGMNNPSNGVRERIGPGTYRLVSGLWPNGEPPILSDTLVLVVTQ